MKFSSLKFERNPYLNGIRAVKRFRNKYSASIVQNEISYGGSEGLYELAVMRGGKIIYNSPITGNVLGWLTKKDVMDTLEKIKNLP